MSLTLAKAEIVIIINYDSCFFTFDMGILIPLLIIYTPLERPDSSPVRPFFFPVFMRVAGLWVSQKASVYSSQKMTFLDGCTQFCTQVAENWGMVFFGQFCLLTRHKK